ncbi:hypothetical protein [Sandaracinus amylolyticus]|uniref:hypothetical protein n=1 Tax=Sandaracinus amylolyticus TaxID=927083 RepID=UPI001F35281D|nr:hypothetical protein [Sandaracinus amylolyticus]UJR78416.1 Hypothetical protein I5071_4430 [Sandaracinus amylolyticus]
MTRLAVRLLACLALVPALAAGCGSDAPYAEQRLFYVENGQWFCEITIADDSPTSVRERNDDAISVNPSNVSSGCDFGLDVPNVFERLCATVTHDDGVTMRATIEADPVRTDVTPRVSILDDEGRVLGVEMGSISGTFERDVATEEIRVELFYSGVTGGDLVEGTPATARCIYDAVLDP